MLAGGNGGIGVYVFSDSSSGNISSGNIILGNSIGTSSDGTRAIVGSVIGVLINQAARKTWFRATLSRPAARSLGIEIAEATRVEGNSIRPTVRHRT